MTPVTLGLWLEARRQEAGLSLDELASRTKIHGRFLDALERGDEGSLPTKVHARAFALAYAKACGAGEEEAARRVREAFPNAPAVVPAQAGAAAAKPAGKKAEPEKAAEPDVAADLVLQPEESLWPWKQWLAIAALAVLGLWGLKSLLKPKGPGSAAGAPAAPAPQSLSATAEALPAPQAEELSLRARRPCWVVLEIDGLRLPTVLLEPDKKETWKVSQKAVVLFGNVGAVRVWWRGQNLDYLGALGARKNGVVFELGQAWIEDPDQALALPPGVPEKAPE